MVKRFHIPLAHKDSLITGKPFTGAAFADCSRLPVSVFVRSRYTRVRA
jgi:hypothetical protein